MFILSTYLWQLFWQFWIDKTRNSWRSSCQGLENSILECSIIESIRSKTWALNSEENVLKPLINGLANMYQTIVIYIYIPDRCWCTQGCHPTRTINAKPMLHNLLNTPVIARYSNSIADGNGSTIVSDLCSIGSNHLQIGSDVSSSMAGPGARRTRVGRAYCSGRRRKRAIHLLRIRYVNSQRR